MIKRHIAYCWTIILLAAIVLIPASGCGFGQKADTYRTQTVKRLSLESKVVANGTVNPVTTVLVGSQVSGKIIEIFVDYNSEVRRGQQVAKIDPALFQAKVRETRARYQQTRADVAKAQANLADAELDFRRNQTLVGQNLVAQNELDKARTRFESSQAELEAAQAQVAVAAAAMKEAETNLGYTTIVSPVDGVVISRSVDVGQTVAASFQTPTLFTIARDLTKMQVEVAVDEGEVGKVKAGQEATFTVDAYPDREFGGKVTTVRLAPQVEMNVVTYTAIVETPNPDLLLMPGMTATLSIHVARAENVLAVPNAALRFLPPPEHQAPEVPAGPAVWRLDARGRLEAVPVSPGLSDGVFTEVRAGDLREGDRLAVGLTTAPGSPAPRGLRGPI
jgi:HlyD family secretion protein